MIAAIGRCAVVFAMFVESDFLQIRDIAIGPFVCVMLGWSALLLLTIQRSWSSVRLLTRKQVRKGLFAV